MEIKFSLWLVLEGRGYLFAVRYGMDRSVDKVEKRVDVL